jgi:hypothetical protein
VKNPHGNVRRAAQALLIACLLFLEAAASPSGIMVLADSSESDPWLWPSILVLGIWGVATAFGLFGLRRWARVSMLGLGGVVVLIGGGAAVSAISDASSKDVFDLAQSVASILIALTFLAFGLWWEGLFTRPAVRELFRGKGLPALAVAPAAPSASQPVERRGVLFVATYLLITGGASLTLNILVRLRFGLLTILFVMLPLIGFLCGVGLLRRTRWAQPTAVAYCIVLVIEALHATFLPLRRASAVRGQWLPWSQSALLSLGEHFGERYPGLAGFFHLSHSLVTIVAIVEAWIPLVLLYLLSSTLSRNNR